MFNHEIEPLPWRLPEVCSSECLHSLIGIKQKQQKELVADEQAYVTSMQV